MTKQTLLSSALAIVITALLINLVIDDKTKLELAITAERSIAGLDKKSVDIKDHNIVYLEGGTGPTIVMIHGFGANKDNWLRLASKFTSDYHVVIPDLPGFGESTVLDTENYDAKQQSIRLKAFFDALGIEQAHVTGNSMGGYIAGDFAARFPDNTLSTWLLNPLGISDAKYSEMFELFSKGEHPYVLPRNEEEFRLLLTKVFVNMPYTPDFAIRAMSDDFQQHYPSNKSIAFQIHKVSDGKISFSSPIDESLKSYSKPLLAVWGDDDRILSVDGLRVLKEKRPETTAILMENMGHAPMIEAPEETALIIKTFLEENQLTQEVQ